MNVLALDPGGTTGAAARAGQGGQWYTVHIKTYQELWDCLRWPNSMFGNVGIDQWDLVGYERFASSVATSQPAIYTIELCGSIQGVCHVLGIKCQRFEPANRTAWLEKAAEMIKTKRKADGKPYGPLIVHEIDALAHLLRYEEVGWDAKPSHGRWGTGLGGGGNGSGVMHSPKQVVRY